MAAAAAPWRCSCGGAWAFEDADPLLPAAYPDVSMGEGGTPLIEITCGSRPVLAKVEYLSPTLSFKDRGAAVLIAAAVDRGEDRVVVDSSGNAGTAIAAYAVRAGLGCDVFVPESVSPSKLTTMRAHRASVHVAGSRADAGAAAVERVETTGAFYATHVWNPWFLEGTKRMVLELDRLPDALVLPYGNGTLVLGAARAFALLGTSTPIIAVRAADPGTVAEGIAIESPPRGADVTRVIQASGGQVVTVTDDEIIAARVALAAQGLYVEPTAAVPAAAVAKLELRGEIVVPLCGASRA